MFPIKTLSIFKLLKQHKNSLMEEEQIQNQEQDQEASSMAALLPIDSFSYSWLLNFPSSIIDHHHHNHHNHHHSYDDSSSSFIEMDPRLPPSRRFFINESFKFDKFDQSNLLHADELFRDGYVLPYLLTDSKSETVRDQSQPLDHEMMKIEISKSSTKRKLLSCVKLRRLVLKYLLTPLCSRLRRFKSSGLRSTETTRRNRVYSDETTSSPRVSVHQADDYWRRSCDSESSIYEAVLHCKKSFEK